MDGVLYFPLSLPFGLKLAPWDLAKVLRPVLAHLRSRGFALIGYIDDFASVATGGRPGSKAAATSARRRAISLFRRLGIQAHPSKAPPPAPRPWTCWVSASTTFAGCCSCRGAVSTPW